MQEVMTSQFWLGLGAIVWVNIILSGDNAVVIALAARSLPEKQQKQAVFWGAAAAVVLRVVLTVVAVELLRLPYLKIIGGALLFWIALKLLMPEDDDGDDVVSSSHLVGAIKTILIADLVMSLDNVIAVAAVAKDSLMLLVLGLLISIPLVVYGATMLMKLMARYPAIITVGAALIGFVAGEMMVTDPVVIGWFEQSAHWMVDLEVLAVAGYKLEVSVAGLIGAVLVVVAGKWLAGRKRGKGEDRAAGT
jgi:YjbE family integral membrane protein